jgi:LysR family transcriptional regulator, benzoate and cis,cis-muconate-responsive activator of ben and cat genes
MFQWQCLSGMMMRMELRHLRYFVCVATELNFTQAARRLRVAQPALSRQVRQLEAELGVQLLERDSHGVRLTAAGRAFQIEAGALLAQSEQAVRVARQTGKLGSRPLRLGYVWGLFHSLVPPLIEQFRRQAPSTPVHLFDLAPSEQSRELLSGELDAGFIGFAQEADGAGLCKRKISSCEFIAALPKGHHAARKSAVELGSLANDFFLGISEETYPDASHHVQEACRRAGFRPKVLQMVERGFTILGLVAGGGGVAILPKSLKAMPHAGVVFRPLTDPPITDLFLAWKPQTPSPLLAEFLKVLPAV